MIKSDTCYSEYLVCGARVTVFAIFEIMAVLYIITIIITIIIILYHLYAGYLQLYTSENLFIGYIALQQFCI